MRQHHADISHDDWASEDQSFFLEPSERTSSITSIVLTLVFSIIFIASSSLNTLFLIIFCRKPSLRNVSNRFIVSLTISNLVSAWVLLPLVVTDMFLKEWRPTDTNIDFLGLPDSADILCTSFNVITDFTTASSIFGTVLIAFDRFFAITKPLHYNRLISRCRSWFLIFFSWTMAVGVGTFSGLITDKENRWNVCQLEEEMDEANSVEFQTVKAPIHEPNEDEQYFHAHIEFAVFSLVFCFALPFLMIIWSYYKIYKEAQQTSERARRNSLCNPSLEVSLDHSKTPSRSSSIKSTSSQIVTTIRRRLSNASLFLYKEEARTAKISVGVIILFFIYWFPFYCTKIVDATLGEDKLQPYVFKVVLIFTLLNSVISPYLYMYRSKKIQKEVLRLFGVTPHIKRGELERRRPIYHQLPHPGNLEKIPASPLYFDGSFNLETPPRLGQSDFPDKNEEELNERNFFLKFVFKKFSKHLQWRDSLSLSQSSCMSAISLNNIHCAMSKNPSYDRGLLHTGGTTPSILTNLLYLDKGALLPQHSI